jgi:hypothetical protein
MCKRNIVIPLLLMVLFVTTTSLAADKYQWKLVDTKQNCQIYTSVVPGKDYIAAKATCVMPARKEVIRVVLNDIANYPKWMVGCAETKMLQVYDDANDGLIFWFLQYIPFIADRDVVLKSREDLDFKNGRDIIYADLTKEIPYNTGKGYVRMPSFSSVWTLEWIDRENTMVTFMIDPDLGKGIPAGIINREIKSYPYKSLKKMMKMVKKSKYIEAAKTSRYKEMVEEFVKAVHK